MHPFAAIIRHPYAVSALPIARRLRRRGGGGGSTGTTLRFQQIPELCREAPSVTPPPAQPHGTVSGSISGILYIKAVASGSVVSFISNVTFNSPSAAR